MDPQTIWKLPRWQHIHGNEGRDAPKFTTADHLYALKPDAKLIVMLRDPVERYHLLKERAFKMPTDENII